jgi:MFS family permease
MDSASTPPTAAITQRHTIRATLWSGFFTNGVWDMLSVLVPLYAAAVDLSTADIGLIVAARSLLPAALSVHGGIVMDYWGTPRVLLGVAVVCFVLPFAYPMTGWFPLLFVLQLMLGLASGLGMSASQTWSLQTSHDVAVLAQFSQFSRMGTFLAPVMVGAIWDAFGAWAAFVCVSVWAGGVIATARVASAHPPHLLADSVLRRRTLSVLIPRWTAHRQVLALAAIPSVMFVLFVSFFRNAPGAIQSSMYVVYLGSVGLSGTLIGALVGICEFAGVIGSLAAAPAERRIRPHTLVILCIAVSMAAIAITPLISFLFPLLVAASSVRGLAQGMSQPLIYSLLGKAVPASVHGATVGLRNAVTRASSIVTPAVMGVVAEHFGIETSFYVMGSLMLLGVCILAFTARALSDTTDLL